MVQPPARIRTKPAGAHPNWVPGQSGNPTGRPKGDPELRAACRAFSTEILDFLIKTMRTSKSTQARIKAAEILLDRGWGKPAQTTETTIRGDIKRVLIEMPDNGRGPPEQDTQPIEPANGID